MDKAHELEKHPKYGMVIDLDKCTGCGACTVACMEENNIPFRKDETNKLRSITWLRVYRINNGKSYPDTEYAYLPRPCQHCDSHHTPCVSVCPVNATDKGREDGIISQVHPRCIGCRYCMAACPYHARYFNWWDPIWPKEMKQMLSPDVSVRPRGVVEKCTFCHHRLKRAKAQAMMDGREEIREKDYQTACTQACSAGAIVFGDLNNPEHMVNKLKTSPNAFRLLEKLHTEPKVYYLSTKKWVRQQADNGLLEAHKADVEHA